MRAAGVLSVRRDDDCRAKEAVPARLQQHIDHGKPRPDQYDRLGLRQLLAGQVTERRKRSHSGWPLKAIGGREDRDVGSNGVGPIAMDAEAAFVGKAGCRDGLNNVKLDVLSVLDRLEESLPHIFAEELPWQEGVGETLM